MSVRLITRAVWTNPGNRGRRLRKSAAAVAWQIQKRTVGGTRLLRLPNGCLFLAHPDCVVSSALIYAEWPEYHELMFLRRSLAAGEVLLDVGAYVGHISLLLADCVGPANIVAFEPVAATFARLQDNWRANSWDTESLIRAAVGSTTGWIYIEDPTRPSTTNRVHASAPSPSATRVPVVRLDEFRDRLRGRRVGLLKVDVEGFEDSVFRGAQQLLRNERPHTVMFESLDPRNTAAIEILREMGYAVFQLDAMGRPDFSRFTNQNLFAVPVERRDGIL